MYMGKAKFDYQPLFGKMSPHSYPPLRGGSRTGPGGRRKSSLGQSGRFMVWAANGKRISGPLNFVQLSS